MNCVARVHTLGDFDLALHHVDVMIAARPFSLNESRRPF